MNAQLPLEAITLVLKDLKGFFTFSTVHGEYVVVRKEDFAQLQTAASETQLSLVPPAADLPTEETKTINKDIALSRTAEDLFSSEADSEQSQVDDLAIDSEADVEEGRRVRFEPLRGDLPPDLQE